MQNTVIRNARMVNEGNIIDGDLWIHKGRIKSMGSLTGVPDRCIELDIQGRWLIPGMIDDQVHFREPGFEHKGTIATESRAAVAGGITSYMEMPNCNPLTVTNDRLADKHLRASQSSLANYAFYLGATNDNLEDIKAVRKDLACGIKVFMGASTGNMLVDNPATLEGIFASSPLLIATHCEDSPTILANEAHARELYGEDIPITEHPNIRSEQACYKSSALAVSLAKKHGARLHILHLTTERELSLLEAGAIETKHITAEACVHHLFFNESWYAEKGNLIKCNPAIKKASDQSALLTAIKQDLIDVIATDHAPHTAEEKARPYLAAPAGLPLVQHALLTLVEQVKAGHFDMPTLVHKTAHAPATLFEVKDRGYLREGFWADLVVLDTHQPTDVDHQEIYSKCGWSPFAGFTFRSRILSTFVNGIRAFDEGAFNEPQRGMALTFNRD